MDGARTATVAGNRAARQVAISTAPKVCAPTSAKHGTWVSKRIGPIAEEWREARLFYFRHSRSIFRRLRRGEPSRVVAKTQF